jgi:hypothetical protein
MSAVGSSEVAELVVFLSSAKGLTFRNATIVVDDVNLFIFDYVSKRDASVRRAKFYTSSIAGWSVTQ